jgi:four helix bundle protein
MKYKIALSDQLEERLLDFAARIMKIVGCLPKTFQARHIATQLLRSGTAGAANYAEARGAESRQDFLHKMKLVGKELNETAVWIRLISKSSLLPPNSLTNIVAENNELCRSSPPQYARLETPTIKKNRPSDRMGIRD